MVPATTEGLDKSAMFSVGGSPPIVINVGLGLLMLDVTAS